MGKKVNRFDYVAKAKEPSTWAALAVLAAFFGPQYADGGFQQTLIQGGVALGGLLGILLGEKGGK